MRILTGANMMDELQTDVSNWGLPALPVQSFSHLVSREALVGQLDGLAGRGALGPYMQALTDYVGATHYLLVRYDLAKNNDLDLVVASNWPFDLVRRLAGLVTGLCSRTSELEKCLSVLKPVFSTLPDDIAAPRGLSREYCAVTFSVGRMRYSLMLLFPQDMILSQDRLRDVGLLASYIASMMTHESAKADRDCDLTDREIECLFWIAEGKTSDEIAVILGISRNTINNYITSVMRKTATKTRAEAIAYAVRSNLV